MFHHTSHQHRGRWGRSWQLILGCIAFLFPIAPTSAQETHQWQPPYALSPAESSPPLVECERRGIGGDKILLRGIRFRVDEPFGSLELRLNARHPGLYEVQLEIRRSNAYAVAPEEVTIFQTRLPGNLRRLPYPVVRVELPEIQVHATTEFTLRLVRRSGPSQVFFEIIGPGHHGCIGVEETETNRGSFAPFRGQPAGFKVFKPVPRPPKDEVPVG